MMRTEPRPLCPSVLPVQSTLFSVRVPPRASTENPSEQFCSAPTMWPCCKDNESSKNSQWATPAPVCSVQQDCFQAKSGSHPTLTQTLQRFSPCAQNKAWNLYQDPTEWDLNPGCLTHPALHTRPSFQVQKEHSYLTRAAQWVCVVQGRRVWKQGHQVKLEFQIMIWF